MPIHASDFDPTPDPSWVLAPFGLITRKPGLLTRLRMAVAAPCPDEDIDIPATPVEAVAEEAAGGGDYAQLPCPLPRVRTQTEEFLNFVGMCILFAFLTLAVCL